VKVLFMGTPDIAATCLSALSAGGVELVGAVCQPDRPVGRGMILTPPPVKKKAEELGIPVFQPERLKDGELLPVLEKTAPELIIVVAYGKILPAYILNFPKHGCINLHVSLLPKYRGAAPMQRAIIAGETETGVTVMQMDEGLDTGDILFTERFKIAENDNFETVHDTSALLGGALLLRAVKAIGDGSIAPKKQNEENASYADKITKEDCKINFTKTAKEVHNLIRGVSPIPLAFTKTPDGKLLKVVSSRVCEGKGEAGTVIALSDKGEGEIVVACGEGAVALLSVIPEGKGRMSAADYVRGRRIAVGDILQ